MLTVTRDAGRPRTYEDDAFFDAAWNVLALEGHSRLTLAAVADRLGCTAPALSKRFGSKRGLLIGFAEWSYRETKERIRLARESNGAALDVLAGFVLRSVSGQAAQWHGPRGVANLFVFHIEFAPDAEFHAIWLRHTRLYEQTFASWLRDAQTEGELDAGCDVELLARLIHTGLTGAAVRWTAEPETSVEDRYREILTAVIEPYRLPRNMR
jgi:AcrR family transcriptional regulator